MVGVPDGADAAAVVDGSCTRSRGDGGGGRRSFATGVSRVIDDPSRIAAGLRAGAAGGARRPTAAGRVGASPTSTTSVRSGCSA